MSASFTKQQRMESLSGHRYNDGCCAETHASASPCGSYGAGGMILGFFVLWLFIFVVIVGLGCCGSLGAGSLEGGEIGCQNWGQAALYAFVIAIIFALLLWAFASLGRWN